MFRKRFEQLVADIPIYTIKEEKKETVIDITEIESESKFNDDSKSDSKFDEESKSDSKSDSKNEESKETKQQKVKTKRFHDFYTTFMVGDIVKVRQGFMMFEGVVVDATSTTLDVDFGDDIERVLIENCCLVMNGLDFEVDDYVSACPAGDLYFNGKIVAINSNGTFDILFDGDDPEDVEHNIRPDKIRKIRTGRQMVINRWQRAKQLISMGLAWAALGHGNGGGGGNGEMEGGPKDPYDEDGIKYPPPAEGKYDNNDNISNNSNKEISNFESKFDEKSDDKEHKRENKGED